MAILSTSQCCPKKVKSWEFILRVEMDHLDEFALEPEERDNQSHMKGSLLVPSIALGYVPFVIIVLMFYGHRSPDETLPGLGFLIFSSMCLVPLLPMYALYLIKIIRQGRGDNTLTTPVAIFYIVSFMVPFVWFLMYAWFATTFNGIV